MKNYSLIVLVVFCTSGCTSIQFIEDNKHESDWLAFHAIDTLQTANGVAGNIASYNETYY